MYLHNSDTKSSLIGTSKVDIFKDNRLTRLLCKLNRLLAQKHDG